MVLKFRIGPGNPRALENVSSEAHDWSEAVQLAFPMKTEDAVLHWGGCQIPIGYKYDVSVILEDALDMLEWLATTKEGRGHFGFRFW